MEMLSIVKNRRSVRSFSSKIPGAGQIGILIEAAQWAPSGLNNQPWKFMVLNKREEKNGLTQFTKYHDIIEKAPVVIVVCLDHRDSYHRDKDIMAIGAAIQNMLLCAHEMGMGTCWLGEIINRKEEVGRYLGIDPVLEVMAVIAVGYPKGKTGKGQRKEIEEILIDPDIVPWS